MTENNLEELKLQKRSRFLTVLEWEQTRNNFSTKHKNLLTLLISRVLQKVSISKDTNIAVVKFLKEHALGLLYFSETLKSEISYLPEPSNHRHNFSLTSGLCAIKDMLIDYDVKVAEAKQKFEEFSYEIEVRLAKTMKHFRNFILTLQKTEEKTEHKNCVWLCEMRYLSSARLLSDTQKNFGNCVKNIWEEAIRLEKLRVSCVKLAMIEYIQLQSGIFNHDISAAMSLLEKIEENNTETLQCHKIFKPEEFRTMEEIGIFEDHIESLAQWVPESIKNFEWVLKEGQIFMENGVFQQWQECYGVVVKSRFLHVFSTKPQFPFVEPIESIYLANAKLMVSQSSEFYVEITENWNSGFFKKLVTGKQIVIKTKDNDQLTEWMELVQSLK